ncbi:HlyD family efflux transporter periplasmic adaptor subunit [Jiella endophytica]|uniref:HlyD family efflux transporter periplasmic adaptor subunit n=1 Tax=Jiella endophytica TaxID=2558362 RepID=A0A4Y8RUI8_9HYPH|nr:HlyD family efflux transporter periplasmic adaptor subunit [Jiella endophytica]
MDRQVTDDEQRRTKADDPVHGGEADAPEARRREDAPDETSTDRGNAADRPSETDPKTEKSGKSPRKRRLWLFGFLAVVLIVAAIAGGWYYFVYSAQYESTDDAFIDGDIVRVSPQESGVLVALPVDNNAVVKPGDVLARIDPAGPMAALALQQANLSEAEAAVGEAEANVQKAKAAVTHDQSTYEAAKIQAENARQQAERYRQLVTKSGTAAISTQQLDDAEAEARQYEASAEAAGTTVESDMAGVASAEASLKSAQAQVVAAKANVANAQVTVDHLTVTASIDGQVVQRSVNLGSYVEPGSQMMAIVPRQLYVTANFKETQLADIRVGQKVDISVDAFPDVEFHGTVQSIQRGAGQAFQVLPPQNATGNFVKVVQRVPVRISIDSPSPDDYPIGPGMSVVPTIHVD